MTITVNHTFATLENLLQVEPTIQDYGNLDWEFELARSQTEVIRVLSVRWWPQYSKQFKVNITIVGQMALMDPNRLNGITIFAADLSRGFLRTQPRRNENE